MKPPPANDVVSKSFCLHIKRPQDETSDLSSTVAELEQMKDDYYAIKGWDVRSGLLTRSTLERLNLRDVADEVCGQ